MLSQLQELVDLVKLDELYTEAVAYGVVEADQATGQAHQQRAHRRTET